MKNKSVRKNSELYSDVFSEFYEVGSKPGLMQNGRTINPFEGRFWTADNWTGVVDDAASAAGDFGNIGAARETAILGQQTQFQEQLQTRVAAFNADQAIKQNSGLVPLKSTEQAAQILGQTEAWQTLVNKYGGDKSAALREFVEAGQGIAIFKQQEFSMQALEEQKKILTNSHASSIDLFRAGIRDRINKTTGVSFSQLSYVADYDSDFFYINERSGGEDFYGYTPKDVIRKKDVSDIVRDNNGGYSFVMKNGDVLDFDRSEVYRKIQYYNSAGSDPDPVTKEIAAMTAYVYQMKKEYWQATMGDETITDKTFNPAEIDVEKAWEWQYQQNGATKESIAATVRNSFKTADIYFIQSDEVEDKKHNPNYVNHNAKWLQQSLEKLTGDRELAYKITDIWVEKQGLAMVFEMIAAFITHGDDDDGLAAKVTSFVSGKDMDDVKSYDVESLIGMLPQDKRDKVSEFMRFDEQGKVSIKVSDSDTNEEKWHDIGEIVPSDAKVISLLLEQDRISEIGTMLSKQVSSSGEETLENLFRSALISDDGSLALEETTINGQKTMAVVLTSEEKQKISAAAKEEGVSISDFIYSKIDLNTDARAKKVADNLINIAFTEEGIKKDNKIPNIVNTKETSYNSAEDLGNLARRF